MSTLTSSACIVCNEPASLRCSKCKNANYCGRDHQVSNWKDHKLVCGTINNENVDKKVNNIKSPVESSQPRQCAYCYVTGINYKSCGKCSKRFYCKKEHQILDWKKGHNKWCCKAGEIDIDYKICETCDNDKGMGMFSLKEFKRGDKIMAERPIIKLEEGDHNVNPVEQLNLEPIGCHLAFDKLYPGDGNTQSIVDKNGVAMIQGGGNSGIFLNFSRVNHSCLGNCEHEFLVEHNIMILIASRDIEIGEELMFRYLDNPNQSHRLRRKKLKEIWGFTCHCSVCLDPSIAEKLDRIDELDLEMESYISTSNVIKCVKNGKKLIELYDDLGISQRMYSRTYFDMYQAAISKRESYALAVKFIKEAYDNCEAYFGYDHGSVISNRGFVANPRSHPNAAR